MTIFSIPVSSLAGKCTRAAQEQIESENTLFPVVAKLSGLPVKRLFVCCHALCGGIGAIAGVMARRRRLLGFLSHRMLNATAAPFVASPDIRGKAYLHALILRLSRNGTAAIVISSDMPELVALADRIAVMKGFRLVETFDNTRDYGDSSRRIMRAKHG